MLDTPFAGILAASVFVTQLLLSGAMGQREAFMRCRFHVAYALYAVLAILCAVTAFLEETVLWYAYFFALVPPAVLFALWEILKMCASDEWKNREKKAKKKKKSDSEEVPVPVDGEGQSEGADGTESMEKASVPEE
jgi:hypothetical protein